LLADCNLTTCRIKSFADDLVVQPGRVRSRVALLLRATERKPAAGLIRNIETSLIDLLEASSGV
jgi:hypothetical protein